MTAHTIPATPPDAVSELNDAASGGESRMGGARPVAAEATVSSRATTPGNVGRPPLVSDVELGLALLRSEAARAVAESARAAAEAAVQAKTDLLATVGHELRTPLHAIAGYAELIELGIRGPVTEAQRIDLGRIRASQQHLLTIISQLLDLARVDARKVHVERSTLTAGETMDAALALVRPQAAAKALVLSEACGSGADLPYVGDEGRVRQVLINLLANAVKFTPAGGHVSVGCLITDSSSGTPAMVRGAPYVGLWVTNTGPGIPSAQLEKIFEPFAQIGAETVEARKGTGLGLTISRHLARLMDGDLTVESGDRAGATFTLWLPTPERRSASRARVLPRAPAATAGNADAADFVTALGDDTSGPVLTAMSAALLGQLESVMRTWVTRLRTDESLNLAPELSDRALEDHAAPFVANIALALRVIAHGGTEPALLLRDGAAILNVISERHGAQRARLGWGEPAVAHELVLLAEVVDGVIEALAGPGSGDALARARALIARLIGQATHVTLTAHRVLLTSGGA